MVEDPWRAVEVTLLPESSRARAFGALRPITLLQGSPKIFSRALLQRADRHDIPETGNLGADVGAHGVRKAHQCSDAIFVSGLFVERSLEWNWIVMVCQVDSHDRRDTRGHPGLHGTPRGPRRCFGDCVR